MIDSKLLFFLFFVLSCSQLCAQEVRIEEEIITEQKYIFENEQQAFECRLSYYDRSDVSFALYSAKGEIRNMASNSSFPVVAFIAPSKMVLYHFDDPKLKEEVLDFEGDYFNPWDCEEVMSNKKDYRRKIIFEKGMAIWIENGDTLSYILDTENPKLYEKKEYLWWGQKRLSLRDFLPRRSWEVEAHAGNRVVLSYAFGSNPYNPMGRCGAGEERGLLCLELDDRGSIVKDEAFALESCYMDIYFSRESRNFGSVEYYYYEVESNEGVKKYYFRPSNAIVSEALDDLFNDQ